MKDEIKERIKYFKHYVVDNLSLDAQEDFQKILDCIINLQEENKRLNNIINKAIEYMSDTIDFSWKDNSPIKNGKSLSLNKLLNILKGSESNE